MINVTLFTKAGCGLCDEVKIHLDVLQAQYPHHLQEIDITQDDALFQEYRYIIPVVQIEDKKLQAPISVQQLQQTLQAIYE